MALAPAHAMCRIACAIVLVACTHRAPPPVVGAPLGQSTAPGPAWPLTMPPDANVVHGGLLSQRAIPQGPPPPVEEAPEEPPPVPQSQPGVTSPPPHNP
jgi:hypothetical protein